MANFLNGIDFQSFLHSYWLPGIVIGIALICILKGSVSLAAVILLGLLLLYTYFLWLPGWKNDWRSGIGGIVGVTLASIFLFYFIFIRED